MVIKNNSNKKNSFLLENCFKMNFKIKHELIENIVIPSLTIHLNKIVLIDEYTEDKIEFEPILKTNDFYKNSVGDICLDVYIEDISNGISISYLLDEDHSFYMVDMEILDNNMEKYDFSIIDTQCEYIERQDIDKNIISNLIKEVYSENTCCIKGYSNTTFTKHMNNTNQKKTLTNELYKICEKLIVEEDIRYFINDGESGTSYLAFEVIEELKFKYPNIRNMLMLPSKVFYGHNLLDEFKERADFVFYIDEYDKDFSSEYDKCHNRDIFMIKKSSVMVVTTKFRKENDYLSNLIDNAKRNKLSIRNINITNKDDINLDISDMITNVKNY